MSLETDNIPESSSELPEGTDPSFSHLGDSLYNTFKSPEHMRERKVAELKSYVKGLMDSKLSENILSKSREEVTVSIEDTLEFEEISKIIKSSKIPWSEDVPDRAKLYPKASQEWVRMQMIEKKKREIKKTNLDEKDIKEIDRKISTVFDESKGYLRKVGYPRVIESVPKLDYYWVVSPFVKVTQQNIEKAIKLRQTGQPELPGF